MARSKSLILLGILATSLLLSVIAAVPSTGRSQEPTAESVVLAELRARYASLTAMRARFEQRFHHRLHARDERWRGRIALARPGRVRIDYDVPRGRVVASDGTTLVSYDPEPAPGHYYEQAVSEAAIPLALGLLLGQGPPDEALVPRIVDASATGFAGTVLELRPSEPVPQLERVWLYVDRRESARGRVHRILVIDHAGNTNRFDLTAQVENPRLPAATFGFRPPAAAERIEL